MSFLSIVIITYNEELNIKRCLDSIVDISDDIIVIDSVSTDKTKEICQNYKLRFIENKFEDYSSQKNFGNNLAKHDFIFSIDADECLSNDLKHSISSVNFNTTENLAYTMNRLNHHSGKPIKFGGWYPDKKLRIWNKKHGEWKGTIHEWTEFSNIPIKYHLKGDLLHYTYNSKEEHITQAEKFAILNAKSDFSKNIKINELSLIFSPAFRFLSTYFLKLGFRDGKIGFFVAKTTAYATFLRKKELLQLNRTIKNK